MRGHFELFHQLRGPLIALAVALAIAVAGRALRAGVIAAAAGGAGVLAGWFAIAGKFSFPPLQNSVEALPATAAATLLIGLLCAWLFPNRRGLAGGLLAALATGWLLSGAPRHHAALAANAPIGVPIVLIVLAFVRWTADRQFDPQRLILAGLTLPAALHVAGAPMLWEQLTLVGGLAAMAVLAVPAVAGVAALPVAADIAAAGCLASITMGRLARLGFAPADAAALSPVLAVWLHPRIAGRLRFAGQAASLTGGLLAGAIAVACVWGLRQVLHW